MAECFTGRKKANPADVSPAMGWKPWWIGKTVIFALAETSYFASGVRISCPMAKIFRSELAKIIKWTPRIRSILWLQDTGSQGLGSFADKSSPIFPILSGRDPHEIFSWNAVWTVRLLPRNQKSLGEIIMKILFSNCIPADYGAVDCWKYYYFFADF